MAPPPAKSTSQTPVPPLPPTVTSSRVALGATILIVALVAGVSFFWAVEGASSDTLELGNADDALVPNRFTLDKLGKARERLASLSDETLYSFLIDHHEAQVLRYTKNNVVGEVMKSIERESAQAGVPLMMDLFSDVYLVWPSLGLTAPDRTKMRSLIKDLEQAFIGLNGQDYSMCEDPDCDPMDNVAQSTLLIGTQAALLQARAFARDTMIRCRETMARFKLGTSPVTAKGGNVPPPSSSSVITSALKEPSLVKLTALLKNALVVEETGPYLRRIYEKRNAAFGEKPPAKEAAAAPEQEDSKISARSPPSDGVLAECTSLLEALELYVADKPAVSALLRKLLLETIRR